MAMRDPRVNDVFGAPKTWPGTSWQESPIIDRGLVAEPIAPAPVTRPEIPEGPPGWIWDSEAGEWIKDPEFEPDTNDELMALINELLSQFNLNTPGLLALADEALSKGWSMTEFKLRLRSHEDYLANPLFAANIKRSREGGMFLSESQVLADAAERKRLAKQYGYAAPSDALIAQDVLSGRSVAEFEHRLRIQRDVETWGGGVKQVMQELGFNLDDAQLRDLFDPEKDTEEWTRAFRRAQYRGRPAQVGMGIRSDEEARYAEALGINPDEWFNRFSSAAQGANRFERLSAIEAAIAGKLPEDFGAFSAQIPNNLLIRAEVFQDPRARAEIQSMYLREAARHNQGGGAAKGGLLSGREKQTFG